MVRRYGLLVDQVRPKVNPFSGRRAEYNVKKIESKRIQKRIFNGPVSFLLNDNMEAYDIKEAPGYHIRRKNYIVKKR